MILPVGSATNQSRMFGPIDQFDRAVVAEQQVGGNVTDGRIADVPPDRQEQLVLGRGESGCARLILRPTLETAERVSEAE